MRKLRLRNVLSIGVPVLAAVLGGCPIIAPPLTLAPASLPVGVEGQAYEQALSTDGRSDRWSVSSGRLPDGISLGNRSGVLAGTPREGGDFFITVTASDSSSGRSGSADYVLSIIPQLRVSATLPKAQVGVEYEAAVTVTGGVPPYTRGSVGLPAGIVYDPATGMLSGTPVLPTNGVQVQFTATDSGNPQQSAATNILFVVRPAPVRITTESLPDGRLGMAYAQSLTAADGVAPFGWAVAPGSLLPNGLRLNTTTGALSGTPTQAGTFTFSIQVTDGDNPPNVAVREFTLTIQ